MKRKEKFFGCISLIAIVINIALLSHYAFDTNIIIFILWAGLLTNLLFGIANSIGVRVFNCSKRVSLCIICVIAAIESVCMYFSVYHNPALISEIINNTSNINSDSLTFSDLGSAGMAPSLLMGWLLAVIFSVLFDRMIRKEENVQK